MWSERKIKISLLDLGKLNCQNPMRFLTRIFFDAKSDEILSIFQVGQVLLSDLIDSLNKTSLECEQMIKY
jgi:hypothetical protein